MIVVLGSFESQIERLAGNGVASFPARVVIDTSLAVHNENPLISIEEHLQSNYQKEYRRSRHDDELRAR